MPIVALPTLEANESACRSCGQRFIPYDGDTLCADCLRWNISGNLISQVVHLKQLHSVKAIRIWLNEYDPLVLPSDLHR
jgi:hypothetical protein